MIDFLKKFDLKRIVTGVVLAVIVLVVVFANNHNLIALLLGAALLVGYFEVCKLYNSSSMVTFLLYVCAFILAYLTQFPIYAGLFCIALGAGIYAYKNYELKNLLPLIYPLMPILCLYQVYVSHGIFYLFWVVFVVALCDSFAYFVGKAFGKTKFSPTSPNKTLEGVLGGVVLASIFGMIYGVFSENITNAFLISFFMAIFAVFGDLFESLLKRLAGVKDSGNLFPGHGGVLDRIDASIFACFAMMFLIQIL